MNPTPPLDYNDALTSLNLLTSQTANFTFTSDEMNLALTNAWNDGFVVSEVWDSSLTYAMGTWQYPIPNTLTTVKEIYIILPQNALDTIPPGGGNYPGKVSSDLWEIVDGNIQFDAATPRYFGDTYTLYLKGNYKLQLTDSLPTTDVINYVLWLAADNLMMQLLLKSAFVFLRNDTQLTAIINAQKTTGTKLLEMKQRLARSFKSM